MSDPLRWWPGKFSDCKRMAHLVEELLPAGDVLEAGGQGVFPDLLPGYNVTVARVSHGVDLCDLPWEDEHFDVGVSARVIEILPPRLRAPYLREMLRVCRYRVFVPARSPRSAQTPTVPIFRGKGAESVSARRSLTGIFAEPTFAPARTRRAHVP